MGLLLSRSYLHGENNSLQSAFYTEHFTFWWLGLTLDALIWKGFYNNNHLNLHLLIIAIVYINYHHLE